MNRSTWPKVAEKKVKTDKIILELECELYQTRNELDLLKMKIKEYQTTQVQLIKEIKYLKHLYE